MNEEDLKKLNEKYQESRELEEQLNFIEQQLGELSDFDNYLEVLKNTNEKEMLAPVGKGIFLKADLKDKDLFVDVGAGIVVKKNIGETKLVISDQSGKLNEMRYQIKERLDDLTEEFQEYMSKFNESKE